MSDNVVTIKFPRRRVPADRRRCLDWRLSAFCIDAGELRVGVEAYQHGLDRLGNLVKLSEEEFFSVVNARGRARTKILRYLRSLDLSFNMDTGDWRDPDIDWEQAAKHRALDAQRRLTQMMMRQRNLRVVRR
jgi:hypothetical protein